MSVTSALYLQTCQRRRPLGLTQDKIGREEIWKLVHSRHHYDTSTKIVNEITKGKKLKGGGGTKRRPCREHNLSTPQLAITQWGKVLITMTLLRFLPFSTQLI